MPEPTVVLGNMNFLSPDSRCFSFDERANGYARGEGILALVIKPLSEAVKDGDTIRAVIRSTGSNQDGRTPGLTQPSSASQERLIRHVYQKAGLDPGLTRYVEAHGTFPCPEGRARTRATTKWQLIRRVQALEPQLGTLSKFRA